MGGEATVVGVVRVRCCLELLLLETGGLTVLHKIREN